MINQRPVTRDATEADELAVRLLSAQEELLRQEDLILRLQTELSAMRRAAISKECDRIRDRYELHGELRLEVRPDGKRVLMCYSSQAGGGPAPDGAAGGNL